MPAPGYALWLNVKCKNLVTTAVTVVPWVSELVCCYLSSITLQSPTPFHAF